MEFIEACVESSIVNAIQVLVQPTSKYR